MKRSLVLILVIVTLAVSTGFAEESSPKKIDLEFASGVGFGPAFAGVGWFLGLRNASNPVMEIGVALGYWPPIWSSGGAFVIRYSIEGDHFGFVLGYSFGHAGIVQVLRNNGVIENHELRFSNTIDAGIKIKIGSTSLILTGGASYLNAERHAEVISVLGGQQYILNGNIGFLW